MLTAPRETADALAATADHIALIQRKRDRLTEALLEAEIQFIAACRREFEAGNMSWRQAFDAYQLIRDNKIPGIRERWASGFGFSEGTVRARIDQDVDPRRMQWFGHWPLLPRESYPPRGQAVVYVLFDAANQPVYVGSTGHASQRFGGHRHAGKVFAHWAAYGFLTRQDAYAAENRFLDQYMPQLNKRRYA